MRAGVFAAGFGTRLGGPDHGPKGLTMVGGKPLIDWVLDDVERATPAEIVIIINEESAAVRDYVHGSGRAVPVRWIVETTPSSMHSFLRVLEALTRNGDPGPFLMSTVDTIAKRGTFASFVERAAMFTEADVVLGLTSNLDDERPFRITVDDVGTVVAVGEGPYATAGYSFVRPSVLREAEAARRAGLNALREFVGHLFRRGLRLTGVPMPESFDVDRDLDVAAVERVIRAGAL